MTSSVDQSSHPEIGFQSAAVAAGPNPLIRLVGAVLAEWLSSQKESPGRSRGFPHSNVRGTFRLFRAPFAKSVPAVFCGISSDLFGAPSANWMTLRCGLRRPGIGFLLEFSADAGSRICRGTGRCRRSSLDR